MIFHTKIPLLALVFSALTASALTAQPTPAPPAKKLLITGYDLPSCVQLRRDWKQMEALPFNGTFFEPQIFGANVAAAQGSLPMREAFEGRAWKREWFAQSIENARAVRSTKLTDNFVNFLSSGSQADFFDDATWNPIVDHFGIAAWYAKSAGIKGVVFDPEHYGLPQRAQWNYANQPQRARYSFAQYAQKARERGRAAMSAMAKENPDLTLLCFFLHSYSLSATKSADPFAALETKEYGLLSPFVDGMLDALPPSMTLVDATENGYGYNSETDFLRAYKEIKNDAQLLVSPPNRAKYRAQVQVGFGLYVDAYSLPEGQKWALPGQGLPRAELLFQNLSSALSASDEYVWLYGEAGRWWPEPRETLKWTGLQVAPPWNEVLPGAERAVALAQGADAYARRFAQSAPRSNLAQNADFSKPETAPVQATADWQSGGAAHWSVWQDDQSKGTFSRDATTGARAPGSGRASGVKDGCWIQVFEVSPFQTFYVAAHARASARAKVGVTIRWQDKNGAWNNQSLDRVLAPSASTTTGWQQFDGGVRVPSGAAKMVVLLTVGGAQSNEDVAWFDDVQVNEVS